MLERKPLESMSGVNAITAEIERSIVTRRSFFHYCRVFGYSADDLRNKKILDVGAGNSNFAEEAQKFGAKVVSLDGNYPLEPLEAPSQDRIRGIAQDLQFEDNVFDETIASNSLIWINTGLEEALSEMIRVTKPGGKIKVNPVSRRENYLENLKTLKASYDVADLGEKIPAQFIDCRKTHDWYSLLLSKNIDYSSEQWEKVIKDLLLLFNFN